MFATVETISKLGFSTLQTNAAGSKDIDIQSFSVVEGDEKCLLLLLTRKALVFEDADATL